MRTQTEAIAFFYEHAGYSHAPNETPEKGRTRGAKALAKAEQKAYDRGFTYRWSIDPYSDSSEFDTSEPPAYKLWQCAMYNRHGRIVNSLHGIDFGRGNDPWGDPYRRVVEAELALEGLTNTPQ